MLERWVLTNGCYREGVLAKVAWVRIVGLPLCLWHRDFFKQVGDACEGFLGVDEQLVGGKNLQWARVLIKTNGRTVSRKVQVVVGHLYFTVYLWWELPPWVASITSDKEWLEVEKKRQGITCMPCRVGKAGQQPAGEVLTSGRPRVAGDATSSSFLEKGCFWRRWTLLGLHAKRVSSQLLQRNLKWD